MTREEHLKFCKICTNKRLDPNKGIVCKLTDAIADFEVECSSFEEYIETKTDIEYNNTICWFCETRPMTEMEGLPIILVKGLATEIMLIPRCIWCNNYSLRQKFFWLSPIVTSLVALTFGTAWTESLPIGLFIAIATVFLVYRLKLRKNKKILLEYKIKKDIEAIKTFPDVRSKLDDGWIYKGKNYRG